MPSSLRLLDHDGLDASAQPSSASVHAACVGAMEARLARRGDWLDSLPPLPPIPSPGPAEPDGASLGFLIMAHRRFAHATVPRLLRTLWGPAHLFLLHVDSRADDAVVRWAEADGRIHLMRRRPVGWGAPSMIEVLLEALVIALASSPHLDFFINLSDADVSLRTERELSRFLGRRKGISFVAAKFPSADAMRYAAHAAMRAPAWLECGGEGFLLLNATPAALFGHGPARCCFARSGPILYSSVPLPIGRPEPPSHTRFFHGSQWVILSRAACEYLTTSRRVRELARYLEGTYMPDEAFVQTALLNSALAQTTDAATGAPSLLNHNLRYIDWPHGYGDPAHYWQSLGLQHASGPMLLSPHHAARVFASPAVFARKVDLERREGVDFLEEWDRWMGDKIQRQAATEVDTGAAAGEVTVAGTQVAAGVAAAGAVMEAIQADTDAAAPAAGGTGAAWQLEGQPAIGADLFAPDGSLLHPLPMPPTAEESPVGGAAAVSAPHAAHYGSEDVMSPPFGGSAQSAAESGAAAGEAGRLAAAAARVLAAQAGRRGAAPPAPAPLASRRRVAGLSFEDGSSCRCDADCRGARRKYANGCCIDWGHVCEGVASGEARPAGAAAKGRAWREHVQETVTA